MEIPFGTFNIAFEVEATCTEAFVAVVDDEFDVVSHLILHKQGNLVQNWGVAVCYKKVKAVFFTPTEYIVFFEYHVHFTIITYQHVHYINPFGKIVDLETFFPQDFERSIVKYQYVEGVPVDVVDQNLAAVFTAFPVKIGGKKGETVIFQQQSLFFIGRRIEMIRPKNGVALVAVVVNDREAVAQIVDPNHGRLAFFQLNLLAPTAAHVFVKSLYFKFIHAVAEQEHSAFELPNYVIGHIIAQGQLLGYHNLLRGYF